VRKLLRFFAGLDSHHRVLVGIACGFFVAWGPASDSPTYLRIVLSWIGFVLPVLLLVWTVVVTRHPLEVRKTARLQDAGRTTLFILALAAIGGSIAAVVLLLSASKHLPGNRLVSSVGCAIIAVALAWLEMHTLFAMRYAHIYYGTGAEGRAHHGGLIFPGEREPDYMDFAYFSFVIGMTSQVSDVQISSWRVRRLALIHGILSFAFNTMILALTINIIATVVLA